MISKLDTERGGEEKIFDLPAGRQGRI